MSNYTSFFISQQRKTFPHNKSLCQEQINKQLKLNRLRKVHEYYRNGPHAVNSSCSCNLSRMFKTGDDCEFKLYCQSNC